MKTFFLFLALLGLSIAAPRAPLVRPEAPVKLPEVVDPSLIVQDGGQAVDGGEETSVKDTKFMHKHNNLIGFFSFFNEMRTKKMKAETRPKAPSPMPERPLYQKPQVAPPQFAPPQFAPTQYAPTRFAPPQFAPPSGINRQPQNFMGPGSVNITDSQQPVQQPPYQPPYPQYPYGWPRPPPVQFYPPPRLQQLPPRVVNGTAVNSTQVPIMQPPPMMMPPPNYFYQQRFTPMANSALLKPTLPPPKPTCTDKEKERMIGDAKSLPFITTLPGERCLQQDSSTTGKCITTTCDSYRQCGASGGTLVGKCRPFTVGAPVRFCCMRSAEKDGL